VVWIDGDGAVTLEPAVGGDHDTLLRRVSHAMCRG
jgi:hypothetical protein